MTEQNLNGEALAALTKHIFHSCYQGDLRPWFSLLSSRSVYLGNGDPVLVGGEAIKKQFQKYAGEKKSSVIREEYHWMQLSDAICQVYGQLILGREEKKYYVINRFTVTYRVLKNKMEIVQQQNSYEYRKLDANGTDRAVEIYMESLHLVQKLLGNKTDEKKLAVKSGDRTVMISPHVIFYVQSNRKHTELVCVDQVISCNCSIGEIEKMLPDFFCRVHRGYLVNAHYVAAVRRFEVEMSSGDRIPIPEHRYTEVKKTLNSMI